MTGFHGLEFEPGDLTGTGTGTGTVWAGHLVDFVNDQQVYLVYCEHGCIGDEGERSDHFYGRLSDLIVDTGTGTPGPWVGVPLPVYTVWHECCDYPYEIDGESVEPEFVAMPPEWDGPPISKHLRVRAINSYSCPAFACAGTARSPGDVGDSGFVEGYLTHDGTQWVGDIAKLRLRVYWDTGTATLKTELLSGAGFCHASPGTAPSIMCKEPLEILFPNINMSEACCACYLDAVPGTGPVSNSKVDLTIFGLCQRGRSARLTGFVNGLPEYTYTECCPPPACPAKTCCDNTKCDLVMSSQNLSGGCTCLDGETHRVPWSTLSTAVERWTNNLISSCGKVWGIDVFCNAESETGATLHVVINCSPNCSVTADVDVSCDPYDFDVEFEVTIDCTSACGGAGPSCCCPVGSYRYLIRLRKATS